MTSFLIALSMFGSINSHMLFGGVVLVLAYRTMYDFSIAAWAFGLLFVGQWAIVICEVSGVLSPQWAAKGPPDLMYQSAQREIIAMVFTSGLFALSFWGTNWAVLRLRNREVAIRLLRETLAASDTGKVGRHTGRTLNDTYIVGALVGAGGMGEVYSGRHRRTKREVAVKLLHPHLVDDPVVMARFRREAEIVGSIGSDHIVDIIDIDNDDDQPFMVLELLDGDNIADFVERDGPMSPEFAAEVFTQMATGLDAAHRADIVHRDLKPQNVVLAETEAGLRVKLLDFGISKIRGNATAITREIALIGTPDYMSPEQAVGATDDVGPPADIFAMGALMYYSLTGHRPFSAGSVPALLKRICDEEPVPLTRRRRDLGDRAAAIEAVLVIAMAKEPAQRYDTSVELASEFRAAVNGEPSDEILARASNVARGQPASASVGDESISGTDATAEVAS
jgi:serine/threonine protein kinase